MFADEADAAAQELPTRAHITATNRACVDAWVAAYVRPYTRYGRPDWKRPVVRLGNAVKVLVQAKHAFRRPSATLTHHVYLAASPVQDELSETVDHHRFTDKLATCSVKRSSEIYVTGDDNEGAMANLSLQTRHGRALGPRGLASGGALSLVSNP